MSDVFTVIAVSERHTYLPGGRITAPLRDLESLTVAELVARCAARFGREGVLILCADTCARLGLPWRADHVDRDGFDESHQAVAELRAAGWKLSRLRAWSTLHADGRPDVHLCLLGAVDLGSDIDNHPLIGTSLVDTVTAMDLWHRVTGVAWRGVAAMAGQAIMRAVVRGKSGRGRAKAEPRWMTAVEDGRPDPSASELEYREPHWRGTAPDPRRYAYLLGYDLNRAYLSGAQIVKVTPWDLQATGKTPYAPDRAGWWLIDSAPWSDKRLPDPRGYAVADDRRWVTGPTMALLDELTAAGDYGGYEVIDSWTATGAGEILRPWAETLRDVTTHTATEAAGPVEAAMVAEGARFAYKRAWGMLNKPTARVHRPDWAAAILAQSRCNLFRRMREIGRVLDRWPVWVSTDCIYYPAKTPDHVAECPTWIDEDSGKPRGIRLHDYPGQLGRFKPSGAQQIRPKRRKGAAS